MKKIILLFSVIFVSCTNIEQSENSKSNQIETDTTTVYQYEPAISVIAGTLITKRYWGPPNYGQDTLVDEKEIEYILILNKPINVAKPDSDISEGYNAAIANVTKIQLIHKQKLNSYLNKKVFVSGTLFGAQTGHHHTEILMDVDKIEE